MLKNSRLSRRENPSSLSKKILLWSVKVSLRQPSKPSLSEPPETCRSSFLLILLFGLEDLHLVLDSTKCTVHFCTEFVFQWLKSPLELLTKQSLKLDLLLCEKSLQQRFHVGIRAWVSFDVIRTQSELQQHNSPKHTVYLSTPRFSGVAKHGSCVYYTTFHERNVDCLKTATDGTERILLHWHRDWCYRVMSKPAC